jgi:hypothetical protein
MGTAAGAPFILIRIIATLAAALCAGCTPSINWTKPGASAEQVRVDLASCTLEAEKAIPGNPAAGAAMADGESVGLLRRLCMEGRGYTPEEK